MDTTAPERSPMTTADPPRLRASDAERTAAVDVLQDAMARGLLTHEEGDERMVAAFAARFRDELPPLTADLPSAGSAAPVAGAPRTWRMAFVALATLVRGEVTATAAAPFRSRRFVVAALIVLALLGGLALVGHVFLDGGHAAHLADHDGR